MSLLGDIIADTTIPRWCSALKNSEIMTLTNDRNALVNCGLKTTQMLAVLFLLNS